MPEFMVHFERDHPEGPPGLETKGQAPVEAETVSDARDKFFEEFSEGSESQFTIVRVEKR